MMSMLSLPHEVQCSSIRVKQYLKNLNSLLNELGNTSYPLFDENGLLLSTSSEDFAEILDCRSDSLVKVIAIFDSTDNPGDKKPSLDEFQGQYLMQTNSKKPSEAGVWAAYSKDLDVLVLDVVGLAPFESGDSKLLLKVLAISDIILFKANGDRLTIELLQLIANASDVYLNHFSNALRNVSKRFDLELGSLSVLGPSVVIHHATQLDNLPDQRKIEYQLKRCFRQMNLSVHAFSSVSYVAVPPESVNLANTIGCQLEKDSNRSARCPVVIFQFLEALEQMLDSNSIYSTVDICFPDKYFSCNVCCLSCKTRCIHSMNHSMENVPHESKKSCVFQTQFNNQLLLCRKCHVGGSIAEVTTTSTPAQSSWLGLAHHAWTGYQLNCSNCGMIYRSKEFWYGNKDPLETAVLSGGTHVWSELETNQAVDTSTVQYLSSLVSNLTSMSVGTVSSLVSDRLRPSYWMSRDKILNCSTCKVVFGLTSEKHHCRSCGLGFCENCSSKTRPVPERGWGKAPVRVCDLCAEVVTHDGILVTEEVTVTLRKTSGMVQSLVGGAICTAADTLSSGIRLIPYFGKEKENCKGNGNTHEASTTTNGVI